MPKDVVRERIAVGAGVALALLLRLLFVLRLPELPLYWDEVHYNAWAQDYARAWQSVLHPAMLLAGLREAFALSIQKGEVYSAVVGMVYAVASERPHVVFVLQAVLDAGTCFFIYGIARQLGGRSVGLTALAFAAVYEPFIFSVARLQTETLCAFVYLGGLLAFLSAQSRRPAARNAIAGLLLALSMLIRPAFQFLFLLWLVLAAVVHRGAAWRHQLRLAAAFAAGFFVLIGPRLALTAVLLGRPLWSGTADPSVNMYAGLVAENLGWRTDHFGFVNPPSPELREVIAGRTPESASNEQFRVAAVRTVIHHPLASARVIFHKLYQVWAHPYNDSLRTFLTGPSGQQCWHKVMLVLATVGLPLALSVWRVGIPLAVTIMYLWATYLAVQIEVRYAATLMPLLVCCAALAAVALARGARACWPMGRAHRVVATSAAMLIVTGLLCLASVGRLLEVFPALSAGAASTLRSGATAVLIVFGAAVVAQLLHPHWGVRLGLTASTMAAAVGLLLFCGGRPQAIIWHQWYAPLQTGSGIVRQELLVPDNLPAPQRAELRLDLESEGPGTSDLVIRLNGAETRFSGGVSRDNAVPPEGFYSQVFAGQGRPARPWHAWYGVAVPASTLRAGQQLEVEVALEGPAGAGGTVKVFGDYPDAEPDTYDGPSPLSPGSFADTSIYKYLGDGDFRLRRRVRCIGTARSRYFDGQGWSATDLSSVPGRQYGRFRIFLVLFYADGRVAVI